MSRPALDIIARLRRRRHADELTDAFAAAIQAAQASGKKATVTVKYVIDPKKTEDYETPKIEISDAISTSLPKRSAAPSLFFLTDDGDAVDRDPNQDEISGLRVAEDAEPSGRDAAANQSTRKAH